MPVPFIPKVNVEDLSKIAPFTSYIQSNYKECTDPKKLKIKTELLVEYDKWFNDF